MKCLRLSVMGFDLSSFLFLTSLIHEEGPGTGKQKAGNPDPAAAKGCLGWVVWT